MPSESFLVASRPMAVCVLCVEFVFDGIKRFGRLTHLVENVALENK